MTTPFSGYVCSLCGRGYSSSALIYVCPHHGDLGNLDVLLDYPAIRASTSPRTIAANPDPSLWRYLPLLPVPDPGFRSTPLGAVGGTPLFSAPRLAARLGLRHLWLKDDSRNPTASFKDRASAVVVARAL
ncbi:MAG: pyridoxal-phosphate dependent enzyme, partial [Chloroflexi bacterium]|nr:pyridoxal-phosphate dependent enzyme [Chloroflexota bacterium]